MANLKSKVMANLKSKVMANSKHTDFSTLNTQIDPDRPTLNTPI